MTLLYTTQRTITNQLQNNSVYGATVITMNCVIII